MGELPQDLLRRWYHSYEEDTAEEEVYRPADFPFPPARGARRSIEFGPDQMYIEYRAGPADRAEAIPGRWEPICTDRVRVSAGEGARTLEVLSVDATMLRIRK